MQMFVRQLLSEARNRLITIGTDARLVDAARALSGAKSELLVVCDPDGKAVGVITKADIVRRKTTSVEAMTKEVVLCQPSDRLSEVWSKMKQHGVRHIPIIDEESRPVGMISARDTLQALLVSAENEVELLRDYVMTVGYQ
jgi:CBS domain-containing protein